LPRRIAGGHLIHHSEVGSVGADICPWRAPNGRVGDVERLRSELYARPFRNGEAAEDGEVEICAPIRAQHIAAKGTERKLWRYGEG